MEEKKLGFLKYKRKNAAMVFAVQFQETNIDRFKKLKTYFNFPNIL